MKDVNVGIFTHASARTGDDGKQLHAQLTSKKKVAFDIAIEKDTFFDGNNVIA